MDLDSFNLVYSRFAHVQEKKSATLVTLNVCGIAGSWTLTSGPMSQRLAAKSLSMLLRSDLGFGKKGAR